MQQAHDLWHAERALRQVVAKIPTAKARGRELLVGFRCAN
jgi:hypothetical protein